MVRKSVLSFFLKDTPSSAHIINACPEHQDAKDEVEYIILLFE